MRLSIALTSLVLVASPALAQQGQNTAADEPGGGRTASAETTNYDAFVADYKAPYLEVLGLLQVLADVPLESEPSDDVFSISTMRLGIQGELDNGFGYLFRADVARDVPLLDARASYRPIPSVRLAAGQYKAPFSSEALTSAANTDFISRARVVRAVAPFRQAGTSIDVGTDASPVGLRAGVFNAADRADDGDSGGHLLLVGRVVGRTPRAAAGSSTGLRLTAGANVAYTPGDDVAATDGSVPFTLRYGGDVRLRTGPVLLAAEALRSEADTRSAAGTVRVDRQGYYLTAGVDLHPDHRVLARIDYFEIDDASRPPLQSTDLVLGYNVTLSAAASAQLNAVVPLTESIGTAAPFLGEDRALFAALVQIAL